MSTGFVYILLNTSFTELVKIGLTKRTSEERAAELQSTGVPTKFIVVHDELVSDCAAVEKAVHKRLAGYRMTSDREFFRIPIKEAVRTLIEESNAYRINPLNEKRRVDLLHELHQLYRGYLKPEIISVAIVQPPGVCFLEVIRRTDGVDTEIVEREDLQIFVGENNNKSLFSPEEPVEENARRFVDKLDAYDYIMTGMPLFTEEACREIADLWEKGGKINRTLL